VSITKNTAEEKMRLNDCPITDSNEKWIPDTSSATDCCHVVCALSLAITDGTKKCDAKRNSRCYMHRV